MLLSCRERYAAQLQREVCCSAAERGMLLSCRERYAAQLQREVCCSAAERGMLLSCRERYAAQLQRVVCCSVEQSTGEHRRHVRFCSSSLWLEDAKPWAGERGCDVADGEAAQM